MNEPSHITSPPADFLFATCQVGAEAALKKEIARGWPDFRLAFSRPGFVTFKLPHEQAFPEDFNPRSVFARAYGISLGSVSGDSDSVRLEEIRRACGELPFERLHVWQRDPFPPGHFRFEPGISKEALAVETLLTESRSRWRDKSGNFQIGGAAKQGERVLDVVVIEPGKWRLGVHRHTRAHLPWPGGLENRELPEHAVSRAYLKMQQALDWSGLPVEKEQRCAELGCSPGGASQALLDRGLYVLGIDPAEVHPGVLEHPRFEHLRKRSVQVRRREFRKAHWLFADMNVAPSYTLDAVEGIVTYPQTRVRGLLLTLKLLEWKLADEIPAYLERIRGWGYDRVFARQLQFNRQEFTVAAWKQPARKGRRGSR